MAVTTILYHVTRPLSSSIPPALLTFYQFEKQKSRCKEVFFTSPCSGGCVSVGVGLLSVSSIVGINAYLCNIGGYGYRVGVQPNGDDPSRDDASPSLPEHVS